MNRTIVRTSLGVDDGLLRGCRVVAYRSHNGPSVKAKSTDIVPVAVGPAVSAISAASPSVRAVDTPLVSMQLSPEKMQSIGVKTGTVEYQELTDGVRATGTVDIDERRVSYVQLRFPGYIRQVLPMRPIFWSTRGSRSLLCIAPTWYRRKKNICWPSRINIS